MIRRLFIIAFLLCAATVSRAQEEGIPGTEGTSPYWGKPIASVSVSGIQSADTFLVINSSGVITGDLLTPGIVQDAVKNVFALGLFSDVKIDVNTVANGVAVGIVVTEYPKLHSLTIKGAKAIKEKKIKENLTLFEGRLVSPEAVKNTIEKIKSMYSEKGYLLVNIDVTRAPVEGSPGETDVTMDISEGGRVRIHSITFSGNKNFPAGKLRHQMSTKEKSFLRGGNFNREKYIADKDKIVEFYKNHGYIDAVVTSDSIWYSPDKSRMFIHVNLKEGNLYYFGKMTWEGNKILSDQQITKDVDFTPGKIYDQKKYDKTLNKIHENYQDEGYWYSQVEEKNIPSGDTVNFHLTITEGNPVHVRMVNIEGNTKTRDKVIRRELTVLPGTVFKRSILGRSLRDLMVTNFYGNVEPGWDILPNGDIDLKLKITEKETGQFSLGAGYSQVDKLVGTIGLGIPNLFGTGQTATLDAQFGSQTNSFSASYLEPWFLDTPTSLSASAYTTNRQWYNWFNERRKGGNIQVGRRLRWPDNYFRVYVGYLLEQINYTDIDSSYRAANQGYPYSIVNQHWPLTTSQASLTVTRDSRDLSQFATKGSVLTSQTDLAGTIFGGDWNYYKQQFTAEYYHKLFWKAVLMGRGRFGAMSGIHKIDDDIPYSDRFAPGGVVADGTIRGYDDGLVGPYDPATGAYLRGRFELIYNLELTIPIVEQQAYIILFADAGNAYLKKSDINLFKGYYRSVGPGFRILIPLVGIMGFDFGYPLDGPSYVKGHWKTHFQIGRGF